jgi:hypothetical protein
MQGKNFWYGKEVEGRLFGVNTCFVRNKVPADADKYSHLFFTIEFVERCVKTNAWNDIAVMIDGNRIITLEANDVVYSSIPRLITNHCHILYIIKAKYADLTQLKKTDTIKIDTAPYCGYVSAKAGFQELTPDIYQFDIE